MNTLLSINSPVIFATLMLLGLLSVVTWSVALLKLWRQIQDGRLNRVFQESFWAARDWTAAGAQAQGGEGDVARLAQAGFSELAALGTDRHDLMHTGAPQELLERQLRQQIQNIRRHHERGLAELATIGSTAPFVGLFGTVWGIMNALKNIGHSGSVALDIVAGPIGEALVTTAIGIATALPAVLAYNYFLRNLRMRTAELENFAHDFMRLALKHNFKG